MLGRGIGENLCVGGGGGWGGGVVGGGGGGGWVGWCGGGGGGGVFGVGGGGGGGGGGGWGGNPGKDLWGKTILSINGRFSRGSATRMGVEKKRPKSPVRAGKKDPDKVKMGA